MLAVALLVRVRTSFSHALDLDELQHLHMAWCTSERLVPYRDFWDNHPLALHALLAAAIDLGGLPSQPFLAARRLMIPFALAAVAGTFWLGASLFDRWAGAAAAVWLSCSELVVLTSCEIRPDAPMVVLMLLGIIAAMSAGHAATPAHAFLKAGLAGVLWGTAAAFSTKAVIPFSILVVIFAVRGLLHGGAVRAVWRIVVLGLIAGATVPAGVLAAIEMAQGALGAAFRYTLLDNLNDSDRFNPWPLFAEDGGPNLLIAAAVGIAWTVWGRAGRPDARGDVRSLSALTAATAAVYFLVMPSPYPQSALLFAPMASVFAGIATAALARCALAPTSRSDGFDLAQVARGQRVPGSPGPGPTAEAAARTRCGRSVRRWTGAAGLAVFAGLGVAVPLWRLEQRGRAESQVLASNLSLMDVVHRQTSRRDVVFDGNALAVFRRHALFRPVLVRGVMNQYQQGRIQPPIRDELRRSACTVVFADPRSRMIPPADWSYIETHFIRAADADWVLLPGRRLSAAEMGGTGAMLQVLTGGIWRVGRSDPGSNVWVGERLVQDEIQLETGDYRVRSDGPPTDVTIWRPMGQ